MKSIASCGYKSIHSIQSAKFSSPIHAPMVLEGSFLEENLRQQHPSSQSGEFYVLQDSKKRNSISTQPALNDQSVVCMFFSVRTSEVELALFEWVQVGEGGLDQVCGESHGVCRSPFTCVGVFLFSGSEFSVWELERGIRLSRGIIGGLGGTLVSVLRGGSTSARLLKFPSKAATFQKTLVCFRPTRLNQHHSCIT